MLKLESGQYLGLTKRRFDVDGVVISEIEYHQKVSEGWHYHQNKHLTLIVKGGNTERRQRAEIPLGPGALIVYNSGELHRNLNTLYPSQNINIEIEDCFFAAYSLAPSLFEDLPAEHPVLKLSTLKAYWECISNEAPSVATVHAILLDLLCLRRSEKAPDAQSRWVRLLKEVIHDRWNETLSLKELAAIAGVHPVTISKNFRKHFSCSLGEYMRQVKIEQSLRLIKQAHLSLTDIALQCGFADQSHFTRTFKAIVGFLPKEFKKL